MLQSESNKEFVKEMIGSKKRLEDYPHRYLPDIIVHEPASLPFGGTYKGLAEFQAFYPLVREFYDFSAFNLNGVFADGDTVFAVIEAKVASNGGTINLVEQFTFRGEKIAQVRLHLCDDALAAQALRR